MAKTESGDLPQRSRQAERREQEMKAVVEEGSVRIEDLAKRFGISLMTMHRDLDELEARGIVRKSRGLATATATSLVESSDVYRVGREQVEKDVLARACMEYIEPGQSVFLDDSTTVRHIAGSIGDRVPLTVVTNALPLINALRDVRGISLIALGGTFYGWCSAFMGHTTTEEISRLRVDVAIMSTAAIVDDECFHQQQETVDVKRAMFQSSARRILLADHTKFEKRALYGLAPLKAFDLVIVDAATAEEHVNRLRASGIDVIVAPG